MKNEKKNPRGQRGFFFCTANRATIIPEVGVDWRMVLTKGGYNSTIPAITIIEVLLDFAATMVYSVSGMD